MDSVYVYHLYSLFLHVLIRSSWGPQGSILIQKASSLFGTEEDTNTAGFVAGYLQSANVCGRVAPWLEAVESGRIGAMANIC